MPEIGHVGVKQSTVATELWKTTHLISLNLNLSLSEVQDIRRRGKNLIAAHHCRNRKLGAVEVW